MLVGQNGIQSAREWVGSLLDTIPLAESLVLVL
jgi:hypothetical protein